MHYSVLIFMVLCGFCIYAFPIHNENTGNLTVIESNEHLNSTDNFLLTDKEIDEISKETTNEVDIFIMRLFNCKLFISRLYKHSNLAKYY